MKELPLPLPGAEPRSLVGWSSSSDSDTAQDRRDGTVSRKTKLSRAIVWWRNVAGTVPAETAPPSRQASAEQRFRNRPGTHGQIKVKEDREREVLKCGGSTYTPSD